MPTAYTGSSAAITARQNVTISEPAGTDVRNSQSVRTPLEKLADYLQYVMQKAGLIDQVNTWTAGQTFQAALGGDLDLGAHRLKNLASPLASTDALRYGDSFAAPTLIDLMPLLATGWSVYPSGTQVNYWKTREGIVRFRGAIWTNGSSGAGATMFTLPAGFRPTVSAYGAKLAAPIVGPSGFVLDAITVTSDGVAAVTAPGTQLRQIWLDGISFLAQQ